MFSPVFIEYLTHFPVYPHQFIKATRKKLMRQPAIWWPFLVYLLEWETHLEDEETHLEGCFLMVEWHHWKHLNLSGNHRFTNDFGEKRLRQV